MGVLSRKKKRPADPDAKLLDEIISLNCLVMRDENVDAETKFRAQDRILKALGLKARKNKNSGSKFDLGSDSDDE